MLKVEGALLQLSIEEAIEANLFEYSFYLGQANGGQAFDSSRVKWVKSGGEVFNRIFSTSCPPSDLVGCARATLAHFKNDKVPVSWLTGPTTQPTNLGQALQSAGFIYRGNWSGMALNLNSLAQTQTYPVSLSIIEVTNQQELQTWIATACAGFQFSKQMTLAYQKLFANLKLGDECPWHLYLASVDGQPVATCSLFSGGGVAGIYWMATLPTIRRQGIGTALTQRLLSEAGEAGYQYVVLHATPLGAPVYRQLGFKEYCKIGIYTWRPGSKLTKLAARLRAYLQHS